MTPLQTLQDRAVVVVVAGFLLLSPPFLLVVAKPVYVAGVPLLYAFVFVAWGGLVLLTGLLSHRLEAAAAHRAPPQPREDGASGESGLGGGDIPTLGGPSGPTP